MSKGFTTFVLLALFFVLTTSFAILAALPWLVGSSLNQPISFGEIHDPTPYSLEPEELILKTSDNLKLQAWEVRAKEPIGVVIFLGGLTNPSVTAFWGHARQFAKWGYSSLLIEMRGHGKSDGDRVGLGYTEHLDVRAGLDYLQSRNLYGDLPKLVFGADLGGVVAINSAGLYQDIAGVISIGAFSSWPDLFTDNLYFSGAPLFLALLEKPFVKLYTLAKFGRGSGKIIPQKQIRNLRERPALIIHSRDDEQVSALNLERLSLSAPEQVEFWLRDGKEHLVVKDFLHPEEDLEYLEQLADFLKTNFSLKPLQL